MTQSTKQAELTFSSRLWAYLELMRPANIVTAFADILAGYAVAVGMAALEQEVPGVSWEGLAWLLLSTFGLYGGGVVFNDVFDAKLDAEERPERAIPSGRVSLTGATLAGSLLLILGSFAAFQVNLYSGTIAIAVAVCTLIYDKWAKHSTFWGPLMMGTCRGGNLLLGSSILPFILPDIWFLAFIPIIYIASITLISQGEVHGGSKAAGGTALGLVIIVTGGLLLLAYLLPPYQVYTALPFVGLFGLLVIPPFFKAAVTPEPALIRVAVRRGVLSLIVLNSALAAGFIGVFFGLAVLALLPLSLLLAKLFAVT